VHAATPAARCRVGRNGRLGGTTGERPERGEQGGGTSELALTEHGADVAARTDAYLFARAATAATCG